MSIRFTNCKVLTLNETYGNEIFDGEVWVKDDKIYYAGSNQNAPADSSGFETVDMSGKLIMPSFKNAHTHSAMTFLRSYADDLPLQEWLTQQVFPMEAKLTPESVYTFSTLAFAEYLTSGITADMDMYMHIEGLAKASVDTGFRTVMVDSINNFGGNVAGVEENYLKYNSYHPLISYKLGFHAEYTTSPEIMKGLAALAEKYKAPVYTHASETERETKECIERYGKTPVALLSELGLLNYGGGIYHGVWLTENDMELLHKHRAYVVTNPSSNLKLASGIAPISELMRHGVDIAIGTDGAASNNALDMFREMYLVTAMAKYRESDAAAVPAYDVLKMACTNGAKAMGLYDCDCIAEGKKADIIALDLDRPNMRPFNNIAKNIVYSGSKENVYMTMIDGKILYKDGKFTTIDIQQVYKDAEKFLSAMK